MSETKATKLEFTLSPDLAIRINQIVGNLTRNPRLRVIMVPEDVAEALKPVVERLTARHDRDAGDARIRSRAAATPPRAAAPTGNEVSQAALPATPPRLIAAAPPRPAPAAAPAAVPSPSPSPTAAAAEEPHPALNDLVKFVGHVRGLPEGRPVRVWVEDDPRMSFDLVEEGGAIHADEATGELANGIHVRVKRAEIARRLLRGEFDANWFTAELIQLPMEYAGALIASIDLDKLRAEYQT